MRLPWNRYQWFNDAIPGGWRFFKQNALRHGAMMKRDGELMTVLDRKGRVVFRLGRAKEAL